MYQEYPNNKPKSQNHNDEVFQSIDEKHFVQCEDYTNKDSVIDQPEFEINRFFNELPIRILNSHQMPFFYAEDVARVLGIKRIKNSLRDLTEKEMVSQAIRQRYNITTYKKYKNTIRRDNKMILLTEFGVYRLIINSKSQLADKFRDFVYDVLYQLRTVGEYNIKAELDQLKTINETNLAEIGTLRQIIEKKDKKLFQFKNFYNEIVLPGISAIHQRPQNGYIYFITEVPFRNKVKIGMSQNPQRRVKDLQTGNPNILILRHVTQYDEYKALERTMHEICKDIRGNGEWFDITESELTGIVSAL